MVLKLYGFTLSPPSKLIAAILIEKDIPFEYINVDLTTGEHKKPPYLAIQPFGEVPCIDDNGFILFESRAICRYLEEKYPTKLIPTDLQKRARFDQATFVELSHFDRHAFPLIFEALFKKDGDAQKIKELSATLATKYDIYEELLSKQKYIAGDEFTLADYYHIPVGSLLEACGVNHIKERPNVARWFNDITSRPAWQKVQGGLTFLIK